MIKFDVDFYIGICFIILFLFIYKPLRKFILSILDSNISKIQKDFKTTYEILEFSKVNLMKAKSRFKSAKLESERITENSNKQIELSSKQMELEMEDRLKKLYLNNQELLKSLHDEYSLKLEKKIVEEICFNAYKKCKDKQITMKQYNLQEIISQIKL